MKKTLLILVAVCITATNVKAQFIVSDPTNFWGNVTNTFKQLSEASKSLNTLQENARQITRLADQYKEYYDKMKKVNGYIQGAKEVYRVYDLFDGLIKNYSTGITQLSRTNYLSSAERNAALNVYKDMLRDANTLVSDVKDIVLSSKYEMSDNDRLTRLDNLVEKLETVDGKIRALRKKTARIINSRSLIDRREAANDRMWGKKKGVKGY